MKCYKCGKAELRKEPGVYEYDLAGLPYPVVLVDIPIERCPACGEEVVTIPDPEGLHKHLALYIVGRDDPILPEEIRFLRKLLDKSAVELSTLIGVDAKTLSRWENGKQKMGTVAERLLRLLVHRKLAPRASRFAEEVFPGLHDQPPVEPHPVKFNRSGNSWQEAA